METTFEQELDHAAGEAIFGMQLNRKQAVKFVLKNVGQEYHMTRKMAEDAVDEVIVGYKVALGG